MNARRTQRVRHETRRRVLQVQHVEELTPRMRRVVLGGEDLSGFVSAAHDDHVKVFFPSPGEEGAPPSISQADSLPAPSGAIARDFTPRSFNVDTRTLTIDFFLHGEGPACQWAMQARPGQWLGIGGPRGSFLVSDEFEWYLLAGDETALPAIARRLEELPAHVTALVAVEVADAAEELPLQSSAKLSLRWLHRNREKNNLSALRSAVAQIRLPPGDGYAWVAGEAATARAVRELLLDQHGLPRECVKAAAYWKRGSTGVHETYND